MEPKLADCRDWSLSWDMNGDGGFSITDIGMLLKSVFYMPGDFILSHMGSWLTTFFEVTPDAFGGGMSGFISFVIWITLLGSVFSDANAKK